MRHRLSTKHGAHRDRRRQQTGRLSGALGSGITITAAVVLLLGSFACSGAASSVDELLAQGDGRLAEGKNQDAILIYQRIVDRLAPLLATEGDEPSFQVENYSQEWPASLREENVSMMMVLRLYTNLGTALSVEGEDDHDLALENQEAAVSIYQQAIRIFQRFRYDDSIEAQRIAAQAAFYLGMTLQDLTRTHSPRQAVEAYQLAISLDPYHWSAYANLGAVYHDKLLSHENAIAAYQQAYVLLTDPSAIPAGDEPTDVPPDPRPILSQLQYRIGLCLAHDLPTESGENEDPSAAKQGRICALMDDPTHAVSCRELATHAFSLAVQYDSDNDAAKHMLATLTADATMTRASNTYVTSLFDDYAANFEHSLVDELGYNGYSRLRFAFDKAMKYGNAEVTSETRSTQEGKFEIVIDAGCGTGLVGEQFRNISQRLIGVDLSRAILDQALQKRPGLYDDVRIGDVTDVFHEFGSRVSLIVAADSYIYFGDLDPLFESMSIGLAESGYIAFTLEDVDVATEQILMDSRPDWKWNLQASGRFAHRKAYVLDVASRNSIALVRYEQLLDFRYEKGIGVRGHIFIMQKRDSEDGHHRDEL
jgi:predicted TPR repeat methyltransferase